MSNSVNYPVIRIPDAILQAKEAMPYVEPFVDPKIEHPGKAPQRIDRDMILVSSAALLIISMVFGVTKPILGLSLLLIGTGAIAWYGWQQWESYPERRIKWERQAREHERYKVEHPKRKRQHKLMVQEVRKPEKVAQHQKQKLQQALSLTRSYDGMGSNHRKGLSEPRFESYLNRYFPGKIQTQLKVQNSANDLGYHYTPDFAYIDSNKNLYIDIEIDEPYNHNGEPIHYIEHKNQQQRDRHFLSRGWLVIRFAEEQVCKWPDSCCKTIATTISSILGNSLPAELANVPDLQPIQRWTKSEAQKMARQNDRDRYPK